MRLAQLERLTIDGWFGWKGSQADERYQLVQQRGILSEEQ